MDKEYWVLLYLVDWQTNGEIFPAVHAMYESEQDAEAVRKDMIKPEKYWVRRVRFEDPKRLQKVKGVNV